MRVQLSASVFRLADWFITESLQRSIATHRRARVYVATCLFGPPFSFIPWLILGRFDPQVGALYWLSTVGHLGFYLFPVALRLTAGLSAVTAISINYTTALLLLGSAQYGGLNSPGLTWFGLLPLVAAFFVQSPRARLVTL